MNKEDFHELLQVTLLAWDTDDFEKYPPFNPALILMGMKLANYLKRQQVVRLS